jgi:hypothetical protein
VRSIKLTLFYLVRLTDSKFRFGILEDLRMVTSKDLENQWTNVGRLS